MDKIIVMKDGQVSESGSFMQLMDHNGAFAEFLKNYLTEEIANEGAEGDHDGKIWISVNEDFQRPNSFLKDYLFQS